MGQWGTETEECIWRCILSQALLWAPEEDDADIEESQPIPLGSSVFLWGSTLEALWTLLGLPHVLPLLLCCSLSDKHYSKSAICFNPNCLKLPLPA